jgi:hypothetical protein
MLGDEECFEEKWIRRDEVGSLLEIEYQEGLAGEKKIAFT